MTHASDRFADTARHLHEIGYTWEEIAKAAEISWDNASYLASYNRPAEGNDG